MKKGLVAIVTLVKETVTRWSRDRAPALSAALAFYMIFSLAPLLLISVTVAGIVFDQDAVQAQIVRLAEDRFGADVAQVVQDVFDNQGGRSEHRLIAAVSALILLFGASAVFRQLSVVLNLIWGVEQEEEKRLGGIVYQVLAYLWSMAMSLSIGLLLILALGVIALVSTLQGALVELWPEMVRWVYLVDGLMMLVVLPLFCGIIFKTVPRVQLAFRDVWLGALMTALLLVFGTYVFGLYVRIVGTGSAYGAASALVALLLWVFYSAQIFLFGAEFTVVYANRHGSLARKIP
jgi:membrane protein